MGPAPHRLRLGGRADVCGGDPCGGVGSEQCSSVIRTYAVTQSHCVDTMLLGRNPSDRLNAMTTFANPMCCPCGGMMSRMCM